MPLPLLPLADQAPVERSDAARNREAILQAAQCLIETESAQQLTMDAVANRARVGKGTVFRRFGSREGLMAALLNFNESAWQASIISGPPPLGPGADPWGRLVAFGRSRIETTLHHADLFREAGWSGRSYAAYSFAAMHLRYLLLELGTTGDVPLLTTALLAPLEIPILDHQVRTEGHSVERIHRAWVDVARRIVTAK